MTASCGMPLQVRLSEWLGHTYLRLPREGRPPDETEIQFGFALVHIDSGLFSFDRFFPLRAFGSGLFVFFLETPLASRIKAFIKIHALG